MNCFVIMPFARDFDDVYASIKVSVEGALSNHSGKCFRLDEAQPAGRITDRLLMELRAASLCVADLTGGRPNVMWEVGFAMALSTPIIIVTQKRDELPFDLKDMQCVEYDRNHLRETLDKPLGRVVVDTLAAEHKIRPRTEERASRDELIGELRSEVAELKTIVSQAVAAWNPSEQRAVPAKDVANDLETLTGSWVDEESGSHLYAAMINGDLIVPYCWAGNSSLVGAYFGWKRVGEHWFSRFSWLHSGIAGFSFLKQHELDVLSGSWWYDDGKADPTAPPELKGTRVILLRKESRMPKWAATFLEEVRREGVVRRLACR